MNNIVSIILCSHKIEGSHAICSNMDGPRDYYILSEIHQKEKDKYHLVLLIRGI